MHTGVTFPAFRDWVLDQDNLNSAGESILLEEKNLDNQLQMSSTLISSG
jgi:hypothetical protein